LELGSLFVRLNIDMTAFRRGLEDAQREMQNVGRRMTDIGSKMSLGITAPMIGIMALATEGTKELRTELGKLEVNADSAGVKIEEVNESYRTLAGLRDDLGANTETVSNLLATGFKGDQLQKVTEDLVAASVKFGETLNPEGLASDLQESIAQGEVTGMFGEMLNRMGVNLDDFNAKLAEAKANGTETDLVLQQMAELGLTQVYDKYTEVNQALIESNQATYDLQKEMAELGKTITPIVTEITVVIKDLVGWFNNLSETSKDTILVIAGIVTVVGPIIFVTGQIIFGIGQIVKAVTFLRGLTLAGPLIAGLTTLAVNILPAISLAFITAFEVVTAPITIVTGLIAGLIYLGYQIYKNWDELKQLALDVWKSILDAVGISVDYIIEHWQGFKDFFMNLWDDISSPFKSFINMLIDGVNIVIDGLNQINVDIPNWVPGVGGENWGINISNIPKFHNGGVFNSPQGEGLAILRNGEQVLTPEQRFNQKVDHSGTITVKGVNDKNQFMGVVDIVMDQLRREARI